MRSLFIRPQRSDFIFTAFDLLLLIVKIWRLWKAVIRTSTRKYLWPTYTKASQKVRTRIECTILHVSIRPKYTYVSRTWISKEQFVCASRWKRKAAWFGVCEIAYLHARDRRACMCLYGAATRRGSSETPYRHANFLRRTQAWPPMMMTRTVVVVVVVMVNANDGGGGSRDHYRTAFATHSAVSVLPVNGTHVVFSRVSRRDSQISRWRSINSFTGDQSVRVRIRNRFVFSATIRLIDVIGVRCTIFGTIIIKT